MNIEQELKQVAMDSYYLSPNMVKFLLVENLALKTFLHEKGLMTTEEFEECRDKAAAILEQRAEAQMREHMRQVCSQKNTKSPSKSG